MASTVFVTHAASNHVGYGFKATVWMVRKAATIVFGIVTAKVIKHQERV